MRRLLLALLIVLLVAAPAWAPPPPGQSATFDDRVWLTTEDKSLRTGIDDGTIKGTGTATFAGLGAGECPENLGQTCWVSDSDTCLGSGGTGALCRWDGSAWGLLAGAQQTLPAGNAFVAEDSATCLTLPQGPCFTTIQAAVTDVETTLALGTRTVNVVPKADGSNYDENVACDLATGSTLIRGTSGRLLPVVGHSGPHVRGLDASALPTMRLQGCSLESIAVHPGSNVSSYGVVVPTGDARQVTLVDVDVSNFAGDANPGVGGTFVELLWTLGFVSIVDSRINAVCGFASECLSDSSALRVNGTDGGATHGLQITRSEVGVIFVNVAGAAAIQLDASPRVVLRDVNVLCEGAGHHCFEANPSNVAELAIIDGESNGGLVTTTVHGQFMTITAAESGSAFFLGATEGSDGFVTDSVWQDVVPQSIAGCDDTITVVIDPDEAGVQYISLNDHEGVNAAVPHAVDHLAGLEAAVDSFMTASGVMPHHLNVWVDTNPVLGSWQIDVRNGPLGGAMADNGSSCTINAGSSPGCATSSEQGGVPIPPTHRLAFEVTPIAAPTAAAEMVISLCLSPATR